MNGRVEITGAPGFVDRFRATLIPGLHEVRLAGESEPVSVVSTEAGEILAVPSGCITFTPEEP